MGAVGDPSSGSRVFQTLNKLDGSGNPTAEEFHYSFDSTGRLTHAAFAQTPQSGQSGYTATYPAGTRARAYYSYDPAGRLNAIEHWWDTWNTGTLTYGSEAILGNGAAYELTGSNRGLKTSSTFYVKNPNNAAQFVQEWTESFGYDADLDYLTSASYTDGQPNANPTWSYDAAGNRNDATVVDNLNRATTIGGVSRTYDILGNTLTKGASTMQWDALNRMLQYKPDGNMSGGWTYQYRADGMRVKKANFGHQDSTQWTKYMYDGQMPVEETEYSSGQAGSFTTVRRNALGARGIDRIETVASQGTAVAYPVYDGHGNMVATLTKSGSGYAVGNRRSFGAWGDVRQGATSGDPKGKYCANLGHQDDDESGLTYMRARYYEAGTGRFVSEDLQRNWINWFAYMRNSPVVGGDRTGCNPVDQFVQFFAIMRFLALLALTYDTINMEAEYGLLMQALNYSFIRDTVGIGAPDWVEMMPITILISIGFKLGGWLGGPKGATIGAIIGTVAMAVEYAGRLSSQISKCLLISAAYCLRLQWYVDAIDFE